MNLLAPARQQRRPVIEGLILFSWRAKSTTFRFRTLQILANRGVHLALRVVQRNGGALHSARASDSMRPGLVESMTDAAKLPPAIA